MEYCQGLQAAKTGHDIIGRDEVPTLAGEGGIHAFGGIDAFPSRFKAAASELPQQQFGIVFRILDYQNAERLAHKNFTI
jgi:hypothetical protein